MESLCTKFWGIMHAYKEEHIFIYISALECFQPALTFKVAISLKIACLFRFFFAIIHLIAHPLMTVKCHKKLRVCVYVSTKI